MVWKHYPLEMHPNAPAAHVASVAAQRQGKFWEFHDKLFADPKDLTIDRFRSHAREIGLDVERFEKDILDLDTRKAIDADRAEAQSLGITGTPAFFINGRFLSGAKPFEEFAKLINAELTALGLPVPREAQLP